MFLRLNLPTMMASQASLTDMVAEASTITTTAVASRAALSSVVIDRTIGPLVGLRVRHPGPTIRSLMLRLLAGRRSGRPTP